MVAEFFAEFRGLCVLALECDEGGDGLALHVIWATDDGGFGHCWVGDEGAFDFGGAEAVTGNIEHIVEAADDPEISLFVAAGAVACGVEAIVIGPVGLFVAVLVAIDRTDHRRPWLADHEAAVLVGFAFLAGVVEDGGIDAEEGQGGGARFAGRGSGQRRDHDRAGFGLPPGIDDRAFAATDFLVVPIPCLGVDRFADRA